MIGVVVVNYGSSALLGASLPALGDADDVLVVVVDNYSSDEERRKVQTLTCRPGWFGVFPHGNEGFGAGVTLGVDEARSLGCDVLVVQNPDVCLSLDAVRRLAERVRGSRDVPTLISPRLLRPDGSVWFDGADLFLEDGRIRSRRRRPERPAAAVQAWLSGAVLAFGGETWDLVQGFAPDYFLYWEDVDLSWRLVQAGGRLTVAEEVVAVHAEGGTQGAGLERGGQAKSRLYYHYNIRNRLLFGARHLDGARWRGWLLHTPAVSWEILLQGGRRQFLPALAPLHPLITGLASGLRAAAAERRSRRPARPARSAA